MLQSFPGPDWARPKERIVAVDLFCGAGGLTRGLLDTKIDVVAGYDIDPACRYAYEHNNTPAVFVEESIVDLSGDDVAAWYPENCWRVLVVAPRANRLPGTHKPARPTPKMGLAGPIRPHR